MADKVKLIAKKRFNFHNPGDTFEADKLDAEVWIRRGLAEPAKKGADAPPADKTETAAPVKK